MKSLMVFSVMFLVCVISSGVFASVVVIEDFESGTIGNTLTQDGWDGQYVVGDADNFVTAASWGLNPSAKVGKVTGSVGQIWKPFNQANTITDSETDVYLKATFLVGNQLMRVGAHMGTYGGSWKPAIEISGGTWAVYAPSGYVTGDTVAQYAEYEAALQINVNQSDITQSTGTLLYRQLGATSWTTDSILQDVVLGLSSSNKPSTWDSWFMRGHYNGGWDDLTLGTGVIPEPSTLALLALGGVALLRKKVQK